MLYYNPDILDTLIHRVNSFADGYRQNIAIIGEPCIGKTSVIKNLLLSESLKKDVIIPIYLEIKTEPFEYCAKRFIKAALSQLVKSDPLLIALKDTVILIEDLQRNYPKTAQICIKVLQYIEKGKSDEAFSFMLDVPLTLFEETGKRPILILDEFHNLHNFVLKNPFGTLAKKIVIQKDTMYIVSSSKKTLSQKLLNEKLSLLFGNFEKVFLLPFDINKSRMFLQDRIKSTTLPQVYLDFIAIFTGNKPFYMQIICDEIERSVFSKKCLPDNHQELIEHVLTATVFNKRGLLNQLFSDLLFKISDGRLLSKTITVLLALSSENKKQYDITRTSKLQSKDVSNILSTLLDMDIIMRNGAFYRFKDRLFKFWLQSVYLKRILSFSIDEEIEESVFRKDIRYKFQFFMQEFEKEISMRIMELFKLFKNDIIQLNGKKHKFMSFPEVQKVKEDSEDSLSILASNGKQKWLCTVAKKNVTENDIAGIIKNSREQKSKNRITRNILVTFSGIEQNAYLMAKEAKFWTWDLETVNTLMELYEKPQIII